ncbi:MAG TPA: S1 family peptidase, partial [Myxococcota bacterium]|nr:S1 family peptidase [Myxococcota bacterium]
MLSFLMLAVAAPPSLESEIEDLPEPEVEETEARPVVGGVDTQGSRWPGIAAVFLGREVGCTGTLIAPRVVLTAAHCAADISGVSIGASNLQGLRAEYRAVRVIEHPRWARTYDVALVILDRDATAEPAVIAQDCVIDASLHVGGPVDIVGYGAVDTRGNRYLDQLQAGRTRIIDPECRSMQRGCAEEVSPGGELSAGGGGVDACFGDSGGPIYVPRQGKMYLAGVTSRGFDDAHLPCSEGGIYVRADAVIDWIEAEGDYMKFHVNGR